MYRVTQRSAYEHKESKNETHILIFFICLMDFFHVGTKYVEATPIDNGLD